MANNELNDELITSSLYVCPLFQSLSKIAVLITSLIRIIKWVANYEQNYEPWPTPTIHQSISQIGPQTAEKKHLLHSCGTYCLKIWAPPGGKVAMT